jgi:monoamine oxidase
LQENLFYSDKNGIRKNMKQKQKIAVIIGAGPAGLTAAYELLDKTDIKPVILEKGGVIGGISQTVNYKGNRIDIGGHRFFLNLIGLWDGGRIYYLYKEHQQKMICYLEEIFLYQGNI